MTSGSYNAEYKTNNIAIHLLPVERITADLAMKYTLDDGEETTKTGPIEPIEGQKAAAILDEPIIIKSSGIETTFREYIDHIVSSGRAQINELIPVKHIDKFGDLGKQLTNKPNVIEPALPVAPNPTFEEEETVK
ncbi:MAG: hypothetical protein AB1706_10135 [Pseudomonadota bacterium]